MIVTKNKITEVIKPFVYQFPCINIVKKTLLERDAVLFVMAMGLGKTITSAFIIEDWLKSGKKGLFLCHEKYILEQVEKEYRKVIGNEIVYKTFYGGQIEGKKDWTADTADMLFASFQSLNNWHEKWYLAFDSDHFDFMVVDESHHGQAPSYKEVINYFKCKKIGMTATPDRMDLKDIREIFGEEVFTLTLEEGIANNWLADVEYHVLSDGINNVKLRQICKDILENGKRISIKQLNESIFIGERDKCQKEIIGEYSRIKEYAGNDKTLIFCERTDHVDNIMPHFEKSGAMHSKKHWKENDEVFKKFARGDLQYVGSVNKFNEGKHVAGVRVVALLRSTDSLTIFWQQLGRALAKTEGKTKVIILDFVSNLERLVMVRDMMLRIKKIQDEILGKQTQKELLDQSTFNVSGEGFDFIFSDELVDVMKIAEALRKGFYETCEEASQATIKAGIKTKEQYAKEYKRDLRLPSSPPYTYSDFPGWGPFFGHDVLEPAPTRWMTKHALSKILKNVGEVSIAKWVEEYRLSHPHWFGIYLNAKGPTEYFHPELVLILKDRASKRTLPLRGWETAEKLYRKGTASTMLINKTADKYRAKNPKWFKDFWTKGGYTEHFHPSLVRKIIKDLKAKKKVAPKGWIKVKTLSLEFGTTTSTVKYSVRNYLLSCPELLQKFWVVSINTEYFDPRLVEIVRGILPYKNPRKNWKNKHQINFRNIGISAAYFLKYIDRFRAGKPNWFQDCRAANGRCAEYFHPALVAKAISEIMAKRPAMPVGWRTIHSLANECKISENKMNSFLKKREIQGKDIILKMYWNGSKMSKSCDPVSAKKIKQYLAKHGK